MTNSLRLQKAQPSLRRNRLAPSLVVMAALLGGRFAQGEGITKKVVRQAQDASSKAQGEFKKLIQGADFRVSQGIDFNILKGVDAGLHYTYDVQPSYQAGLYTRLDRWTPRGSIQLANGTLSLDPGAEVIYLRLFDKQEDAIKALPEFSADKIPLSTENALNLRPGEVVMVPVHMNLALGPTGTLTHGFTSIYANTSYVMRGEYMIEAMRMADQPVYKADHITVDHVARPVHLRLVAIRQQGVDANAGVKNGIDIFEYNPINKLIQSIAGKDVVRWNFDDLQNGVVMVDYMFDLSNPDASAAYDELLDPQHLQTNVDLVNPFIGQNALQTKFVQNLDTVNAIVSHDASLPPEQRRIRQIFNGRSSGKTKTYGFNLSPLKLVTWRDTTTYSNDTHVSYLDENGNSQDVLTPLNEQDKRLGFLFGLYDQSSSRKAQLITPADSDGHPKQMGEYVISLEIKDKQMDKNETAKALNNLNTNIAPSVVQKLGVTPLLTATSYTNARVFAQIIFNEKALAALEGRSAASLVTSFFAYLEEMRSRVDGVSARDARDWARFHSKDIIKVATNLALSFDPNSPPKTRIETFMNLQRDKFFRAVGTGFLMSLLPEASLDQLLSVDLRIDASAFKGPNEDAIVASFGTSDYGNVVKATEYIQHLLDQGSFDLRLETFGLDAKGVTSVVALSDLAQGSETHK